jgi:hypothetical protein
MKNDNIIHGPFLQTPSTLVYSVTLMSGQIITSPAGFGFDVSLIPPSGEIIGEVIHSGGAEERGKVEKGSSYWIALCTCIFALVISFASAIWFGYEGSIWLSFASLGPLFAAFIGIIYIEMRTK